MPDTAFFSPEIFVFLKQLKRNNDREWFAKNKERFQECAVKPALALIDAFAPHLHDISPNFLADADPREARCFAFIATRASRTTKSLSRLMLGFISRTPRARTRTRQCFTCTWNRADALLRRESGIPITAR